MHHLHFLIQQLLSLALYAAAKPSVGVLAQFAEEVLHLLTEILQHPQKLRIWPHILLHLELTVLTSSELH